MIPLPIANILHHKLRSTLSALGVGIAVCMLVTLSGLARGTLEEIADRWEVVDADLIVYPAYVGDNIATISGGGLGMVDVDATRRIRSADGSPAVERATPIFLYNLTIGAKQHNVVGVTADDLPHLLGGGEIRGRRFDPDGRFARWLAERLSGGEADEVVDVPESELAAHGGLEMIVDTRLARKAGLDVGSKVHAAGHEFEVVGIVPAGALARAFIPRATAEYLFNGTLDRFTLMFVKLREGARVGSVAEKIRAHRRLTAIPIDQYRAMLRQRFGIMYIYVDVANAITLIVAVLFILVTLFTIVVQRTREIAILKSMGSTWRHMLVEVWCESLLLTWAGAMAGVGMSFAAAALIEGLAPLLTVTITPGWIAVGVLSALAGGTLAAVYPAWFAARVDVVEALNLE